MPTNPDAQIVLEHYRANLAHALTTFPHWDRARTERYEERADALLGAYCAITDRDPTDVHREVTTWFADQKDKAQTALGT